MEFEVVLRDNVYDEVFTLMANIDKLNGGNEIGGWLLGDWKYEVGKATLILDKFVIPKQDVSGGEVDISPESMADTLREMGADECNRIKAHWHIHPFGKGGASWSGTDEEKIKDFTQPDKGRDIFVFLLSSEDKMKARVEINLKGRINSFPDELTMHKSIDDVEVKRENQSELNPIFEKLHARIKEKVQEQSYTKYDYRQTYLSEPESMELYAVTTTATRVNVTLEPDFADFIRLSDIASAELANPSKIKEKKNKVVWKYNIDAGDVQRVANIIEAELENLAKEYEETATSLLKSNVQYPFY